MKLNKMFLVVLAVLAVTWVVALIYEPRLPERMPTHWNMQGQPDAYTDKPWGVFMLPLISTITSILLFFLPKIAPKGFKLEAAKRVYEVLILILAVFMLGVMVLVFEAALDQSVNINQWIMAGIGLLFILIGNYLTKVPKNFFLGIRTPWTLASDEVWYKTHRVGAWTFVICGILVLILAIVDVFRMVQIAALVAAGLVPLLYSLWAYKKIEGFQDD